jgi:cytochrome c553
MVISRRTFLKAAAWLAGLALAGVAGAVLLAYSGLYSVAASRGHPAWLDWFLETGMRRSVEFHSGGEPAPDLDDPDLISLGAAHFQGGCAPCHGAPGQPINPVYDHMLPSPPSLSEHAGEWSDQELFWIVRHGIQYAGMPAWSGEGRDDEVWAMAAFLRRLPSLDAAAYNRLAQGGAEIPTRRPGAMANAGLGALHLTACARCHDNGADAASDLAPRLAGQSPIYLQRALEEYRNNRRQSGVMEPVAAELDETQIGQLAEYYGSLAPAPVATTPEEGAGAALALQGDPDKGVPPCGTCHGASALADYPRLAGQPAPYVAGQLKLWRKGGRAQTPQGKLMAEIARRLSDEQIDDVARYYAGAEDVQ